VNPDFTGNISQGFNQEMNAGHVEEYTGRHWNCFSERNTGKRGNQGAVILWDADFQ
jgi:hypothetical protein